LLVTLPSFPWLEFKPAMALFTIPGLIFIEEAKVGSLPFFCYLCEVGFEVFFDEVRTIVSVEKSRTHVHPFIIGNTSQLLCRFGSFFM